MDLAGEPTTGLLDQATAVDPSRLDPVVGQLRHDEMAAALRRAFGVDALEGPAG